MKSPLLTGGSETPATYRRFWNLRYFLEVFQTSVGFQFQSISMFLNPWWGFFTPTMQVIIYR